MIGKSWIFRGNEGMREDMFLGETNYGILFTVQLQYKLHMGFFLLNFKPCR